jgi:hypothetical protein
MSTLSKPSGCECADWRVPTLAEAQVFLHDSQAVTISGTKSYLCIYQGELGHIVVKNSNGSLTEVNTGQGFTSSDVLRPVITITY